MNPSVIPVIVVPWNRAPRLCEWLANVRELRVPTNHVIRPMIVDDASSDITPAIIGEAISKGGLKSDDVHWLPSNYGFTKAQNVVFRLLMADTSHRFVATLNEDATADSDWLAQLVAAACGEPADSRVGMWCGPTHRPAPNHNSLCSVGHWLRKRDAAFLDIDRDLPTGSPGSHSSKEGFEPFCPCFAAALWSLQMMRKVGLPDSAQFMYYDDVDLGYRARLMGWHARYVSAAKAFHPLPKQKPRGSLMWRHQQKGRLAIACRYLPDQERVRILAELSQDLRLIYDELAWEGRNLTPVGTPDERTRLWDCWADRNRPDQE